MQVNIEYNTVLRGSFVTFLVQLFIRNRAIEPKTLCWQSSFCWDENYIMDLITMLIQGVRKVLKHLNIFIVD